MFYHSEISKEQIKGNAIHETRQKALKFFFQIRGKGIVSFGYVYGLLYLCMQGVFLLW